MEGRLLLKNCALFRADGRLRRGMAVLVEGNTLRTVTEDALLPVLPGDWAVDCKGRVVAPGLVDCHTHLVAGQLVPSTGDFLLLPPQVREEHQARLEQLLSAEEVEILTRFALARAMRAGVTLVVEHLNCSFDVMGSLMAQARAARALGIRLVTSHATQGAGEDPEVEAQVEANAAFARAHRSDPLIRGALGFHTSSTCDDALLRKLGRMREELGVPAVFHLSETEQDLAQSFALQHRRPVPRLESFGLLGAGCIAAHARFIDRSESERLALTRTFLALSPHLSLVSEPGSSGFEAAFAYQNLLGLGSAGQGGPWEPWHAARVSVLQLARSGRLLDPEGVLAQLLVDGPAELCSMLFGQPSGAVEEGRLADLVVYDCLPAEDPDLGVAPNLLVQLSQSRVAWTVVHGRVTVREGQLLGVDYLELAQASAKVVSDTWARARLKA